MDGWMDLKTTNDARKDLADLTRLVQVEVRDDDGRRRRAMTGVSWLAPPSAIASASSVDSTDPARGLGAARAASPSASADAFRTAPAALGASSFVVFASVASTAAAGRGLAGVRRVVVGHVARVENLAKCVRDAARVCGAGRDACAGGTRGAF